MSQNNAAGFATDGAIDELYNRIRDSFKKDKTIDDRSQYGR